MQGWERCRAVRPAGVKRPPTLRSPLRRGDPPPRPPRPPRPRPPRCPRCSGCRSSRARLPPVPWSMRVIVLPRPRPPPVCSPSSRVLCCTGRGPAAGAGAGGLRQRKLPGGAPFGGGRMARKPQDTASPGAAAHYRDMTSSQQLATSTLCVMRLNSCASPLGKGEWGQGRGRGSAARTHRGLALPARRRWVEAGVGDRLHRPQHSVHGAQQPAPLCVWGE